MSRPAATSASSLRFAEGVLEPGRWTVFENVACLASVPSSNDLARELIDFYFQEEQLLPPTLLVAEEQPNARGRGGRQWKAPRGRGLYLTFLRRIEGGAGLPIVPIAVAHWVQEAIESVAGLTAGLKWPNDVLVGRRKIGGVLSEARTQGNDSYVAVGIGVNVLGSGGELGVPQATTIEQETGRRIALAPLLQSVVDAIDRGLARSDWPREIEAWQRLAVHRRGDRMRIRVNGLTTTGEYRGLDTSGFLKLATAEGESVFPSGELEEW